MLESDTYYALADHQNTVHGFVDAGGALVARYEYDAWGNLLSSSCTVPALADNRYLFQGREYSSATGLYNFRARWYDPATGRWLSKDPSGLKGGLNLYAFCDDNPVNHCDPTGLKTEKPEKNPPPPPPDSKDPPMPPLPGPFNPPLRFPPHPDPNVHINRWDRVTGPSRSR